MNAIAWVLIMTTWYPHHDAPVMVAQSEFTTQEKCNKAAENWLTTNQKTMVVPGDLSQYTPKFTAICEEK
jgi:hypothetical protein